MQNSTPSIGFVSLGCPKNLAFGFAYIMYPYPHVDDLIPLMADGTLLPYLDIPLQHASPKILKAMKRPGSIDRTLERIKQWRKFAQI